MLKSILHAKISSSKQFSRIVWYGIFTKTLVAIFYGDTLIDDRFMKLILNDTVSEEIDELSLSVLLYVWLQVDSALIHHTSAVK